MKKISFLLVLMLCLDLTAFSQVITVPSANTNTGSTRYPLGTFYGYQRSAMIYTASEVGSSGLITAVGFYVNATSTPAAMTNMRIYIKQVAAATLSANTYATETTGATLVYGPVTVPTSLLVTNNWITFPLSVPFCYSNTSNLEVIVETNATGSGSEGSAGKSFRYATASNAHEYWETDGSAPTGNGSITSNRPNIQITKITLPAPASVSNGGAVCAGSAATLTAGGMAPGGKCVTLNGSNQYFCTPNIYTAANFPSTAVTLEIWFKPNAAGTVVAEQGSQTPSTGWYDTQLEILSSGEVKARVWNITSISLGCATFGTWNHAVLRYNGTVLDGFLNGILSTNTTTAARTTPWSSGNGLYYAVGPTCGTNLGSGAYFNGQVDEFRVWNTAVSTANIQSWMYRELDNTHANWANLVAYYKFNNGASTTDSKNSYTLSAFNAPTVNVDPAYYFYQWTGTNALGISSAETQTTGALASGPQAYTVKASIGNNSCGGTTSSSTSVTVNPAPTITGQPGNQVVCGNNAATFSITASGATSYQWQWSTNPVGSWADIANGQYGTSGSLTSTLTVNNPTTNAWNPTYSFRCIATGAGCSTPSNSATITVYNPTANYLYTNPSCSNNDGTITFSGASGGSGSYEYSVNNGGSWQSSTSFTGLAAGGYTLLIRNSGAPNCPTTIATISLAAGYGPIAAVPTVSNNGPICSGATVNLTAGGLAPGSGGSNGSGAYSFNGTSNYINTTSTTGLPTGSVMTVEAWINPAATQNDASYNGIVAWGPRGCSGTSMLFSIQNNLRLSMATWCNDVVPGTGPSVRANTWSHVAVVCNGTSVSFYINGQLAQTGTLSAFNVTTGANQLTIGCTDIPGRYFNGSIDNVRIWSSARSQSDIQADMYKETPTSNVGSNLKAHYKLNGDATCTGNAALNATVNGATAFVPNFYTYIWNGGTGSPSGTAEIQPTTSGTSPGQTYTVVATANGCASSGVSTTVAAYPNPSVSISTNPVCLNSTVTLTASTGSSFNWYNQASGGSVLATGSTYTPPAITGSTSYWVEAVNPGAVQSLATVLSNFNANNATITAQIPSPYNFVLDGGTNYINDGGNDMYDGGNYLNTNLGTTFNYSDNTIISSSAFGTGGQYFTRKVNNMFILAADVNNISSFYTTGNLGADGSGTYETGSFQVTVNGQIFSCYLRKVYGAGDPSVNQIVIVPGSGAGITNTGATTTDDNAQTVSGLSGVTRLYYLLFASSSGGYVTNAQAQNIVNSFLSFVVNPGCATSRVQSTINVYGAPSVSGTTAVCNGQTTTLTASGSTPYFTWFNQASGGTPVANTAAYVTPPVTGPVSYWVEGASMQYTGTSLATVLANFNSTNTTITGQIPSPYNFTLDGGTNYILDGGNDMYDGGNYLNTNLGTTFNYSDNTIVSSAAFGTGGQYFTRKVNNMFILAADVNNISSFYTTGNLGADGSGSYETSSFQITVNNNLFSCFVRKVYGAGDPSINQIVIVPGNGAGISNTGGTTTDDNLHTVSGLTGVTRIYYLLFASSSGGYVTAAQAQNVATSFIQNAVNPYTACTARTQVNLTLETTAPTVSSCPSNITTNANASCYGAASWTGPTWSDNCMTPPTISGATYLGTTGGNYYYLVPGNINWTAAKTAAEAKGGRLVVIESAAENAQITSWISSYSGQRFWIGLTDAAVEGTFKSVYGVPHSVGNYPSTVGYGYSNWNGGEPNDAGGEDYAEILQGSGGWNDLPDAYAANNGYIMEFGLFQTNGLPNGCIYYPLGVTTNTYNANDFAGNTSSTCSFNVTVNDVTAPAITCGVSGTQSVNANTGVCTYTHTSNSWNPSSTTDNCSVASVVCALTGATTASNLTTLNGQVFNNGTTNVTWTVKDGSNNTTTCGFTVVVSDNQAPTITCGVSGTQNVNMNTGVCTYAHNSNSWNPSATADNCGVSSVTCALSGATTATNLSTLNGVTFNPGTTNVVWTVKDAVNNSTTCGFTVVVSDNQAPSITCGVSGTQNVNANTGVCTYTHTSNSWNPSSTGDNCGVSSVTCALSGATTATNLTTLNGQVFNKGTTTVTWTVKDAANNTNTCGFTVIVSDNQLPQFSGCPSNIVNCNPVISWTAPIASDNCSILSVVQTSSPTTGLSSGSTFPVGVTTITYTATDVNSNISNCSFTVTVNATPTVTLGANPAVCQGTTVASISYSNLTGGANQYTIDFDNTANAAGLTDVAYTALSGGVVNITVPGSVTAGTYNAALKIKNSTTTCESGTYAISVTVDAPYSISSSAADMCEGSSRTLTSATAGGVWSANCGACVSGITFNAPTPGANSASYTITYSVSSNSCPVATQSILVYHLSGAANAGADIPVGCGLGTTLGAVAPAFGTGTWSQLAGAGSTTFNSPNAANSTTSVTALGAYTYTWTVSNGVCSANSDNVDVTYNAAVTSSYIIDDCMNSSTNDYYYILVNGAQGNGSYTFSGSPINIISSSQVLYEQQAGTTTSYTVTDGVGCSATVTPTAPSGHPQNIPFASSTGTKTVDCYEKSMNKWLTFRDNNNDAILSINDSGFDLGLVNVTLYRDGAEASVFPSGTQNNCQSFTDLKAMKRHFMVTASNYMYPAVFPGNVGVRLYFSDAELQSLIISSTGNNIPNNSCSENDDITSINELYVTKYSGPAEDGDYSNNLQSGVYRVYGDANAYGTPNGPLTKVSNGFGSLFNNAQNHHYVQLSVDRFSEFWMAGSKQAQALPVEMIYLEANAVDNSFIQVRWATALEINNQGFSVERSVDGINFSAIAWVDGHNNSTVQQNYTYNDNQVQPGVVYYYRLKQIDFDGQFEYTDVVSAKLNAVEGVEVRDFVPNPSNGKTILVMNCNEAQQATVDFYNIIGDRVFNNTYSLNKGGNSVEFDLNYLAAGTYTAVLTSGNSVYTKKLVITH
ncbi:MAG: LamG-like jellyroll fold domain-containing protein [Chitinophagales bacterium]